MLNNKQKITDINEATREVGHLLKEELGNPISVIDLNEGRYKLLKYPSQNNLVLFKREMYLTFEEGRGETINKDDLKKAMEQYSIKRVFIVYGDSKIYVISPWTIISQGIERTTEAENKEVISFPVKLLIRFNEFKEVMI
jgi:hypothetical protein